MSPHSRLPGDLAKLSNSFQYSTQHFPAHQHLSHLEYQPSGKVYQPPARFEQLGQRNKLAITVFDQVCLEDKTVIAVKPRTELDPFFRLNYEEFGQKNV